MAGRFKEILKKYGKVALGVHFSVSAASITGLYIAIKNNIDVESFLEKCHLSGLSNKESQQSGLESTAPSPQHVNDGGLFVIEERSDQFGRGENSTVVIEEDQQKKKQKSRTAELAGSTGGALALAVLCNKALIPIRVPITIALTPPVSRFLARRRLIKTSV